MFLKFSFRMDSFRYSSWYLFVRQLCCRFCPFPAAAKSKTPALVFSALLAEEWERDGVSRLAQLRAACWSKELVGGSHLDLDYG